jgi:hypothetical protein
MIDVTRDTAGGAHIDMDIDESESLLLLLEFIVAQPLLFSNSTHYENLLKLRDKLRP